MLFLTARDATARQGRRAGPGRRLRDQAVQHRRAGGPDPGRAAPDPARTASGDGRLRFADLVLDEETHEVWRADELIELTATEFNLLRYLLVNARRVVSKAEILDAVWDYGFAGDSNIVETYISYLRKKVDRYDPPLVHTIRRVGYSLREPRP